MSRIKNENGRLMIPDTLTVPYIEGDGVGQEITSVCIAVTDAAIAVAYKGKKKIKWKEVLAGEKAFKYTGEWLPEETMQAFREYIVGLKGPLTTPVGEGIRSLNVALRQELDLYVCLRPVRWFKGVESPLKRPQDVDMYIFRENTEDIYAGIEWEQGTPEACKFLKFLTEEMGVKKVRFPETSGFGVKPVSIEGTERLVRAAICYAIKNRLPSVTLVHKGNIMKFTEGGFKKWGYALADREFAEETFSMNRYNAILKADGTEAADETLKQAKEAGRVIVKDVIADAFLQNTLLHPKDYSVVATLNLNGDYISDQLAAMVGGIGIAPGANINFDTGYAIFEATHGTAPDIAGQNRANPSSIILSAVMLLGYVGWHEAASLITKAMEECFRQGLATEDLARLMPDGKSLTTSSFRDVLIQQINCLKNK